MRGCQQRLSSIFHAYFLIRNASFARNSAAFSSSFLGAGAAPGMYFKKALVEMTMKSTHFLRHLALVRIVADMVGG